MSKIKELYLKHKELWLYIFFGGLTTLVNLVIFYAFELILGAELYLVSNFIAWVGAALFAFFVNKLFVFESRSWQPLLVLREGGEFLLARVFSFLVEEAGLWLLVDILGFDGFSFKIIGITITGALIAKVILAVVVIILNYFFSKFIIFKKDKTPKE